MGCSGIPPKQSIRSAFYIGFRVGRKRGWSDFFLRRNQNRTDTEALAEALAPDTDTKEEHSMAASHPAAATEQWRMLYNTCTTVRSVRPLIFLYIPLRPAPRVWAQIEKCDFPRGFFELEVEILTRDSHVYSKRAQNWDFWILFFFNIFFKNQIPEFTCIGIPHEKK